jgi:hypothetical protein
MSKHWSNVETMKDYLFFPHIARVHDVLKLDDDLAIFDNFSDQVTPNNILLQAEHNVHIVKLPPNCSERLQPMDLTVNKAILS